ncbi:MAG TPA: hypothetical protein VK966_07940, partial [Longimicrobiales bacterium]|nr:hypothetical protein [Longimicrobiales bacterium]
MLATLALAVAPGGLTADQGTDLVDALTTAAAIHSEVAAAVAPMAVAASRMAYGVAPASGTYVGPGPRWVVVSDVGMADRAPEAWDRQDPADSLYRAARSAMNRSEYEEAAELFHRIWNEHPRSTYAPDAPYWEAFNRYRTGETRELEGALEVLEAQRERYASAPTRANGDAAALRARVRGQLASRGDEEAAREMVAVARAAAGEAIGPAMMAATEAMEAMDVGAITAEALEGARVGLEAARYSLAGAMGGGLGEVPEGCQDEVEVQSAALNALMHMDEDRA